MQLLVAVGAAGKGITVDDVDYTITVQVFLGVSDAVAIEIPAGEAICARHAVDAVELVVQLDAVFGLTLSGSPWVSAKLRTVNTIVDAIMEVGDEP